jgi:hypothetical protein
MLRIGLEPDADLEACAEFGVVWYHRLISRLL